jgi:phage gp29-like protein
MANTPVEKVANVFSKLFNPLRSLTKPQIERMVTNWHHGDDVRMQMVFSEIETQSSIYQVCINKRTAGVVNREWDIVPEDESAEAKAQAEAVKKVFRRADRRNEDGLTEALKHLVMSAFRGRSAVKPFFDQDGNLFFKKLNNWNVLRYNGRFYWNPSSEEVGWFDADTPPRVTPLPEYEICYLTNDMPIDVPGLMLYLRQLVGEEQWSRFVEKQGIPQVVLNTPEGTPDTALALWNQRAMQIFEGGSGTLPYDAKVNVLDSARGQDPFTSYIQHQMEMISILATGGTLMTIGGSTGLGSDLARVQQESFNSLVNQDCRRLANAMTDSVVSKVVHRLFPGKGLLCRFDFVEDDEYSAQDYLDMALKLNQIGVKLDSAKLKEATKLAFIQDVEEWSPSAEAPNPEWTPEEREELRLEMEAEK